MKKFWYDKIQKYGIKRALKLTKSALLKKCYYKPFKGSFGQYGEDIIIDKLLGNKPSGFYVDVGAFDPDKLSNTKRFYLKGWKGINIEPNPKKIKKFNILRPDDINLDIGISNRKGEMLCYKFRENNSYTFSKEVVAQYLKWGLHLEKEFKIKVDTLKNIFDRYLEGRKIDFISIDTEGHEMAVLQGNNWQAYRPKLICIESFNVVNRDYDKKQEKFLNDKSYKKVYNNGLNSFYINNIS